MSGGRDTVGVCGLVKDPERLALSTIVAVTEATVDSDVDSVVEAEGSKLSVTVFVTDVVTNADDEGVTLSAIVLDTEVRTDAEADALGLLAIDAVTVLIIDMVRVRQSPAIHSLSW